MTKLKKDLLFLHGALGVSTDLAPLIEYFGTDNFNIHTLNFSGHGKDQSTPAEFRIDLFARDLDQYITKHQLKNPVVFGYSMGGYVALYHKANFEDSNIEKIFTYGTKFNWSEAAVKKELPLLDPETIEHKYPQFAESLRNKHGDRWKVLLLSTAHMMQNLERLDGLTREDLNAIEIPVFLILGDLDRMVTSEETHLTSSWLHHSQLKTISHSKHEMERANLKEIANIIMDNLD